MKSHAEEQSIALEYIRKGLATKVRILVSDHACPVCQQYAGAYELDDVPAHFPDALVRVDAVPFTSLFLIALVHKTRATTPYLQQML